jgi:hypothetical protein
MAVPSWQKKIDFLGRDDARSLDWSHMSRAPASWSDLISTKGTRTRSNAVHARAASRPETPVTMSRCAPSPLPTD